MRFRCIRCHSDWSDHGEPVALIQEISPPVRDCPECMARQGWRWVDASRCQKIWIGIKQPEADL